MLLSGLVAFLLMLTADAKVGDSDNLTFCSETEECLMFEPICESGNYEVRQYESAKWVTTEESTYLLDYATMKTFRRLFSYIKDNNVEMTAPVLMKMETAKKYLWQKKTFSMSFLLPSAHQANPPTPADDKLKIVEMPAMKVYVKSFGGWMFSMTAKNQAGALSTDLDSVGAKYESEYFYAAGYNSPMSRTTHNEVWFVVLEQPVCPSSPEMD